MIFEKIEDIAQLTVFYWSNAKKGYFLN